nr:nuclear pore complex protein NUP98A [Tanacetum cinerariifolium]
MFEQNPATERSRFTTPSSPFGNPSQESQPIMGMFGTPPLEASSKPDFGNLNTPASASSVTPAFGNSSTPSSGPNSTPAFGNTGSAFGVSNCLFGSTTPVFGTFPTHAYCSTPSTGSSFSFASAKYFYNYLMADAFWKCMNTVAADEHDVMAVVGCLRSISTILKSVGKLLHLFAHNEQTLLPIMRRMLTIDG